MEIDGVLLSIIHAHCIYVNRRQLWMDLHQLSLMNLPWLILGDFNAYPKVTRTNREAIDHLQSRCPDFTDFCWFQSLDGSSLQWVSLLLVEQASRAT
ncbi:hypothetical protein IFM89_032251 [Coptis chinensis]|uniref:Endonuclease/exonuclease/phosphatase domain-containing protein n=1 Tax=Coptis chinensis TaxID=261450 RepID=A0A835M535_9MAGN|nr:hypothetical protein IFM89_032251 [Coptis chinensis]